MDKLFMLIVACMVLLPAYVAYAQPQVSLTIDNDSYYPRDHVLINFTTSEIISYSGFEFQILDPLDNILHRGTVYPNSDGFATTMIRLNTLNPVFGMHTILVRYGTIDTFENFELKNKIQSTLPITLNTDKIIYLLGHTVLITGTLNKAWTPTLEIDIIQTSTDSLSTNPSDLLEHRNVVQLDGDGNFEYSIDIVNDTIRLGTYTVTVHGELGMRTKSFIVSTNLTNQQPLPTQPLEINTDKFIYQSGELIQISGTVSPKVRLNPTADAVTITIYSDQDRAGEQKISSNIFSNTEIKFVRTAIPDASGRFSLSDRLYKYVFTVGSYSIQASYDGNRITDIKYFDIVDKSVNIGDISTSLKQIVGLGEKIVLNGNAPGVSQGVPIEITLISPVGTERKFTEYIVGSNFTWTWDVPKFSSDANNEEIYGLYRVLVDIEQLSSITFFKVSKNPQNDSFSKYDFELKTNKNQYTVDQPVTIFGTVPIVALLDKNITAQIVKIRILSDNNMNLGESKSFIRNTGDFSTTLNLNPLLIESGIFKIYAEFANYTTSTQIIISGKDEIKLTLTTDKKEYTTDETIKITLDVLYGEIDDVEIFIYDSENKLNCNSQTCVLLDKFIFENISFPHIVEFDIPNITIFKIYQIQAYANQSNINTLITIKPMEQTSNFNTSINSDTSVDTNLEKSDTSVDANLEKSDTKLSHFTVKSGRITQDDIILNVSRISHDSKYAEPLVLRGSLFTPIRGEQSNVNLQVEYDDKCIIGQDDDCMISDSTRSSTSPFETITIDKIDYDIRYNGPDSILEQFSIIDKSRNTLVDSIWNVKIISGDNPFRFYHMTVYQTE